MEYHIECFACVDQFVKYRRTEQVPCCGCTEHSCEKGSYKVGPLDSTSIAKELVLADRAALHKALLGKIPGEIPVSKGFEAQSEFEDGWNSCLTEVRKAIDEVFNSKK